MAEAGFWVVWGLPSHGRENQALELLKGTRGYLENLQREDIIEHFDVAILRPQSSELGGFILIQGTKRQIDSLRRDNDFQRWVNHVQMVVDKMGVVDAWVDQGLDEAISLYEDALRRLG